MPGRSEEEEIIELIAQELRAGKSVEMVAGELQQAGLPRDEAITVVNAVAQQIGLTAGAPRAPAYGPPRHKSNMMTYLIMIIAIGILLWLAFKR